MVKEFVQQWEENKESLREYFKNTKQEKYSTYEKIVEKLFEICIPNTGRSYGDKWELGSITVVDDGDYQGTQLYIIPTNKYQPSMEDYIIVDNYYGSCSGCDALQGISNYDYDLPSDSQVEEYMTLCLHLVQRIRWVVE